MLDWINPSFPQAIALNLTLAGLAFVITALIITNLDHAKGSATLLFGVGFLIALAASTSLLVYNIYCLYLIISTGVETGKDWALIVVYAFFLIAAPSSGITVKKN